MMSRNCAAFSVLFVLFWSWCCGFVLISSSSVVGAGGISEGHTYESGSSWLYRYSTGVLLDERNGDGKNVGFLIGADVLVESIWSSSYSRLLRMHLKSPKLMIRSRKAPEPDGFTSHSSNLETQPNAPFYVLWNKGKIEKIYFKKNEPLSMTNLKKGLASLFQFQLLDQEVEELDASGHCTATYLSLDPTKFRKIKSSCKSDLPVTQNPDLLLSTIVVSSRISEYELSPGTSHLTKVESEETHEMYIAAKEEVGNKVETYQTLNFVEKGTAQVTPELDFKETFSKIEKEGAYVESSLSAQRELLKAEDTKNFAGTVADHREILKSKNLGSLGPAKSFIQLVSVGRRSSKEDILKTISGKKNQKNLPQLYDVLGHLQTLDSHNAAMKKLNFEDKNSEELSERYLWALSMSSQPHPDIIMDLLKRCNKANDFPGKVRETLLLTIASMTYTLSKLPHRDGNEKVINVVKDALLKGLQAAKKDEKFMYLRSLRNLKLKTIIPVLLKILQTENGKQALLAWKALRAMEPSFWNDDVLTSASRTFYQLGSKQDSSSRTLAADIILQSNPSDRTLKEILYYLLSEDDAFEVKQYVLQQLKMMGDENPNFESRVLAIVRNDTKLNNWNVLSQKGLSTALTRNFLRSSSSNGSLLTVQEMHSGIVKRGVVNIMMDKDGVYKEIFSLGVFSGGLGAFLSSDSGEQNNDEIATAGMELSLLGVQMRPFVFFEGQGELMGHVWSGTASEKTTAYQALVMLQDHLEFLHLGPGFIAELDLKGAVSFDLSGKIEFSLWNRNAVSLVEKAAGLALVGTTKVDTLFVRSQVEFNVAIEPKLDLQTDIDFQSGVNLCMRLSQPDSTLRHNIFKIERIPGSKHSLRKTKYKKYTVPGTTYALNKKNNEMCNVIFQ